MVVEDYLSIPVDRVAVLIGTGGITRKQIEVRGKVELDIAADGQVKIVGNESLEVWKAKSVVKAIGRGFSPEPAMQLFDEEFVLEIIDLKELLPNERAIARQKARIIGRDGKMRKKLEHTLFISLSVYGNTASIIGKTENVEIAKASIEKLVTGAMHNTALKIAQKPQKEWELY